MPEAIPTVQENPQEQPVPEAPRDPSPAGVQPRDPSPAGVQDHHEVIHAIPDPAPPPLYTPYQALEGLNEQLDDGVGNDDVVIETPPNLQTQEVNEPPTPNMGQTRPRRTAKPNPKYSPEIYDVSYIGVKSRTRSRRSVRRAVPAMAARLSSLDSN